MQERASRTAVHVALFRALESARRHERLFIDPYAIRFLPSGYRFAVRAARVPPLGRWIERYIDTRWSGGPRGSAVMRTRLIDDWVVAAIGAGAGQLLLLGAGYDSRAYRLPEAAGINAFEVDHPATQAVKARLIDPPGRVRLVPVDLLRDELEPALATAGFDHSVRTVAVWEGVTNYLDAEAVDGTFRYLRGATPPGSRLIFTYIDKGVLDRTTNFANWKDAVAAEGEPWTFGFDPAELPAYLAERGLRLVEDVTTRKAAERFGRQEPTAAFYRVALAIIG
jgi:methyltransferase (TIGR00027 family)